MANRVRAVLALATFVLAGCVEREAVLGMPGKILRPPAELGSDETDGMGYGYALATGELDGDGIDDLVVGAPFADGLGACFLRTANGDTSIPPPSGGGEFGAAVAVPGDLDGDGVDEVVVGAPGSPGVAYILSSGSDYLDLSDGARGGEDSGAAFGFAVSGAGDANGDGYADLAVGAPESDGAAGRVYLFEGAPVGGAWLGLEASVFTDGDGAAQMGSALLPLGDVDGDGYDDLAVGAPGGIQSSRGTGGVILLMGGSDPWTVSDHGSSVRDADPDLRSGISLAGPFSGPGGTVQFVAGAEALDAAGGSDGAVVVYEVGEEGLVSRGARDIDAAGLGWGRSLAVLSGPQVVVGAPEPADGEGRVDAYAIYPGTPELLPFGAPTTFERNGDEGSWFGWAVAAGDYDGDGLEDLAVGVPGGIEEASVARGEVWIYDGRWTDIDGDGYPTASDCSDVDPAVHPGADETVGDEIDEDCDGTEQCGRDQDGDGARATGVATKWSDDLDCTDAGEATASAPPVDCDDGDAANEQVCGIQPAWFCSATSAAAAWPVVALALTVASLRRRRGAAVAATLLLALSADARAEPPCGVDSFAGGTDRVALVIGNGRYAHVARLDGAPRDADLVCRALEDTGFTVMLEKNAGMEEMTDSLVAFGRALEDGATGVFYYSGHGVERFDRNFLIPVDADLPDPEFLRSRAVDFNEVLLTMARAGNRLNIALLDACRENPWENQWPAEFKAFARGGWGPVADPPSGFLIGYATGIGHTALDGQSQPGPYARALATEIRKPKNVVEVFQAVHQAVFEETDGRQKPWLHVATGPGDFYFTPPPVPPPCTWCEEHGLVDVVADLGGDLYVDDRRMTTLDPWATERLDLPAGTYVIRVGTTGRVVSVVPGTVAPVRFEAPPPGSVRVIGPPGTAVTFDGHGIGAIPSDGELVMTDVPPGRHAIGIGRLLHAAEVTSGATTITRFGPAPAWSLRVGTGVAMTVGGEVPDVETVAGIVSQPYVVASVPLEVGPCLELGHAWFRAAGTGAVAVNGSYVFRSNDGVASTRVAAGGNLAGGVGIDLVRAGALAGLRWPGRIQLRGAVGVTSGGPRRLGGEFRVGADYTPLGNWGLGAELMLAGAL